MPDNEEEQKSYSGAFGGAVSFEQAESAFQTQIVANEIEKLNFAFQDITANIMADDVIVDKAAAITALVSEYTQRISAVPQRAPKQGFLKQVADFFSGDKEDQYDLIEDDAKRRGPAMKRDNGIDFPARDYAYVPDPSKPVTWKLRLTESPGKVTPKQLGRAAAAVSTGGFRGKRASIPKEALSSFMRRIRQEYRKLGVPEGKIPTSIKIDDANPRQKSSFMVVKDLNDQYRWFSVYSNNYRDEDMPPEIISTASHRAFLKSVDAGVFDMPELWLWHWDHPVGDTDWLDFTDDGLALASGTFRRGYEWTAKALSEKEEPMAVSHGMPKQFLVRDEDDPSIILFHVTKEISPLPLWAAANKLTGFTVLEGASSMAISDERKDFLRSTLPPDIFDDLNDAVERAGKDATEEGRESKEQTPADETVDDSDTEDEAESKEIEYATRDEVAETLTELTGSLIKALKSLNESVAGISERINGIESSVKELEVTDEHKVANLAEGTPTLSLGELVATQWTASAKADKSADPVNEDGPSQADDEIPEVTGISVIDNLFHGSMNGGR